MKNYKLISFTLILLISACKKDQQNKFYDVYIVGYHSLPDTIINGVAIPSRRIATLWFNDSLIPLSDSNSIANAIFLKDNNIYIAGGIDTYNATYWVNSIRQNLPTYRGFSTIANDIAANANNVYVCGYIERSADSIYTAKLWRNGAEEILANSADAAANAIAIAPNSDVYVVGWKKIGNTINAVYWKNGQQFILGIGVANDIFMDGNNVFIGGHIYNSIGVPRAAYWKNNLVNIIDNEANSDVVAVSFSADAVFTAGRYVNDACYWRNTQRYQVQTSANGTDNNYINRMATYGNSAISVGSILVNAEQKAYYWINRSKYKLPVSSYDFWSEANDIAVVEK